MRRENQWNTSKDWVAYGVEDAAGRIVYVGLTTNVRRRLADHLSEARRMRDRDNRNYAFHRWLLRYHGAHGVLPNVRTLCTARGARHETGKIEAAEISRLQRRGEAILNAHSGDRVGPHVASIFCLV